MTEVIDQAAASPARVQLVDAQRVLGLFAQGMCARYLHLKPTRSLTGNFRPDGVTTDGTAIYLPEAVDSFDSYRHNLGAYRIAVLHQLGFFENGTFEFSIEQARARIPELPEDRPRPGSRAVDLERFFAMWSAPALMRRVFMTLEDMRIDESLHRRYPGARADLERVMARALIERPGIGTLPGFTAMLEGLVQYTLGAERAALLRADRGGLLEPLLDAASGVRREDANVYDSARAAMACYRMLEDAGLPRTDAPTPRQAPAREAAGPHPAPGDTGDPVALRDEDASGVMAVGFRGEVIPELVQRQLRAEGIVAALVSTPMPADDGQATPPAARHQLERHLEADRVALYRTFGSIDAGARSYLYDEWDFLHQTYVKGWCRLYEHRLRGEDFDFIHDARQRHMALARRVKRQFAAIRPESLRRMRRVSEGDELEIDAVIETVLDRRAGQAPEDRVYARREKAAREVAAAFLLDMSASTDYPIPDPDAPAAVAGNDDDDDDPFLWSVRRDRFDEPEAEPPKRRVIDVARESLALMCEALETLGDRYAVYGFSGYGHDEVEFYVAKAFEDRLAARTWAAVAAMKPRRSTRMGPAIRHAVTKLQRQDAKMRLLIVISDGYPEDHDYGPDRSDHEYGIQDTARALQEAERAGVQTFCVTIDRAGRDYLRRMCADERYMVIDEVEDLPEALTKVYRALTV